VNDAEMFERLVENALCFMRQALDDLETRPKYSVINFYAAIELFLKARLLHEHWSLTVSKDPDWNNFVSGDFMSVNFEQARDRLDKVVRSGIDDKTRKRFDAIRKHRNRMVHFFHNNATDNTEAIAIEQLNAWYELNRLLLKQWAEVFSPWFDEFIVIDNALAKHRGFLKARFDALVPQLNNLRLAGTKIVKCPYCSFEAAVIEAVMEPEGLQYARCQVCECGGELLDVCCPKCGNVSPLYGEDDGCFECDHCHYELKDKQLTKYLDESAASEDNYFADVVPADCGSCGGIETVVLYGGRLLCINCLEVVEPGLLVKCDFCGTGRTGNFEDSDFRGCGRCDGKIGPEQDDED
jgi:hypothetical protein